MPELFAKAAEYLAAGAELVWIVEPEAQAVTVLTPDGGVVRLGASDALDGAFTLPGFSLPLADLFRLRHPR